MSRLLTARNRASAPPPSSHELAIADKKVPVDKFGMPFLFHPGSLQPSREFWDDDHSFFFSNSPELTEDAAGVALRLSRVQHLPRRIHNLKHNRFFMNGVQELPRREADKFGLTVLACAGYASRTAIDVRGDEPRLVRMSNNVYKFVKGRNQLHPERGSGINYDYRTTERAIKFIGMYFADYLKRQNLSGVIKESLIDEFLHTKSEATKRHLGNLIIRSSIIVATDPVAPKYRKALKKELVRPGIRTPRGVVATIFPVSKWADYYDEFRRQLLAA